jgi:quercetin dioxygenase-like cupin family protein
MAKLSQHRLASYAAVVAATLIGAACVCPSAAAGECPKDKFKEGVRAEVKTPAQGVTDTTLGSIDLEKEPANIKERELRFRKLTILPGGVVPWHSHGDRPAIIFVEKGKIEEYASNCSVPIVHKVGDIRPELHNTSHWWKNVGKQSVILYVADVRRDPNDHNM